MTKLKVTVVGSGNWGSAIARIVGKNVKQFPDEFNESVKMWVFEETINGRKLTEIINTDHENVKYLPGFKLPPNVIAEPDLAKSCEDSDILIFVLPHQFIERSCKQIGKVKSSAVAVSLVKGLAHSADNSVKLISEQIRELLHIDVSVLMGANLANEVAADQFCEATIGAQDPQKGAVLKRLFQTEMFRISVVPDCNTVEMCGALKNIVACAAGFSDGLGYGDNTKSALIRLGLAEMRSFIDRFYPGSQMSTFFQSCGVADLITTCYGGRNHKVSQAFVKSGKTIEELEKEMLGGQQLQGPATAAQAYTTIQKEKLDDQYPIFVSVHKICTRAMKPEEMVTHLQRHPDYKAPTQCQSLNLGGKQQQSSELSRL